MHYLSDYKALLFDVDNTLTQTNKHITPETFAAIKQTEAQGYHVATCTGKAYIALRSRVLPHFSPESVHVTCGGAQVVSNTGEVLWQQSIAEETVKKLATQLLEIGSRFFITQNDALYASPNLEMYLQQHPFNIPSKKLAELKTWQTPLIGVYSLKAEEETILHQHTNQISYKKMHHHISSKNYCDITANGVNKYSGLQAWSEATKIPLQKVIGFGDSENDLEFLNTVGYSVAMGNATNEVKTLADRVIGHTDDDGLEKYLTGILKSKLL